MLDLLIKGGTVVTPWGSGLWDVGIVGEKIANVSLPDSIDEQAHQVLDATGKIVVPGGIEPHAHISAPIMGHSEKTAPPEQVSLASMFGGTTSILDFAIQYPGFSIEQA